MSWDQSVGGFNRENLPGLFQGASDPRELEEGVLQSKGSSKGKNDWQDASNRVNDEINILLILLGLLVATATALLIYIQPQLGPSPGDETNSLLQLLIYTVNNSSFGGTAPEPFDWVPPSLTVAIGEFVLYVCLCASLCSGLYVLVIKFFTGRYGLGWKNNILDWFTRWIFFIVYLSLGFSFLGTLVALTFQIILRS